MISRRRLLQLLGGGLLAGVATTAYALAEAAAPARIERYAFTPRRWTEGLDLRIAVIADLHACNPWMPISRIRSICAEAMSLDPDLILLLGDYMSGMRLVLDHLSPEEWAPALATLQAPLGVHAVLGNHDYWQDEPFQLGETTESAAEVGLRNAGIPVYRNRSVRLEKDGHPFWLAGLDDQMSLLAGHRYGRSVEVGLDDLGGTLAQVTDDAPVVLMAHEPDIFPRVPDSVSLTISGHTHGGQFNLFGWRPFSASHGSRRFPAGYFEIDGRQLIVSRGLGCSTLPMRIGSPPEIVLLELGARGEPSGVT